MIKNWLGRQDLEFQESLIKKGQEMCRIVDGLFEILKSNSGHRIARLFSHCNTTNSVGRVMKMQNNGWGD